MKKGGNRDAGTWIRLAENFYRDGTPFGVLRYFTRYLTAHTRREFYTHALYLGIPEITLDASFGDYIDLSYFIPVRASEELYPPPRVNVKIRLKFLFTASFTFMLLLSSSPFSDPIDIIDNFGAFLYES